uniref:Synaptic vesicular amine transporter n=1 Tax=Schistosoma haematobium TaxID=6185 RepID=A0A095A4Z3_SCHHA
MICSFHYFIIVFAFETNFYILLIARAIQGVGSACSSVSGMGMLATYYIDETERGRAFAIALSGLAIGLLSSITFGNLGMSVLEPTLPLWMKTRMNSTEWQQGIAFLPASLSYLVGTNIFGPIAHRIGSGYSAGLGPIVGAILVKFLGFNW